MSENLTQASLEPTSLQAGSPVKTSLTPASEKDSQEIAPPSGSRWRTPFAYFGPALSSSRTYPDSLPRWVPAQENLLSEVSSLTWPKQVTWDLRCAYELQTSVLHIFEKGSSSLLPSPDAALGHPRRGGGDPERYKGPKSQGGRRSNLDDAIKAVEAKSPWLLPTPAAHDDGKTPEQHLEMKRNLPGGPRLRITSLTVLARAGFVQPLLPTPSANDNTGGEGKTRKERQDEGETGGASLRDISHLLPTPTVQDATNTGGPSQEERNSEPLNLVAKKLLPTPMANPENPGAGGELRAAIQHGPSRRNQTGVDTWGRPNRGRSKLLPTPTESDADSAGNRNLEGSKAHPGTSLTDAMVRSSGESTNQPSSTGSESSDDELPAQLTIADA
jgi:hypothetical protein